MIVDKRSVQYMVISGEHSGCTCVLMHTDRPMADEVEVIFLNEEFWTVRKDQLKKMGVPGWEPRRIREVRPYGLKEYLEKEQGTGSNILREPTFAQPRALKKNDVLATGEIITDFHRMGYNDSTIFRLNQNGWVEPAARLPIALAGNHKFKLPMDLTKGEKLATGCLVIKKPVSKETDWVTVFLDTERCDIDIPFCIPLALE